jgi:hypothetical protein
VRVNPLKRLISPIAHLDAFLGAATLALVPPGEPPQWHDLPAGRDPVDTLLQLMRPMMQGRRVALRVWLSGALARPFMAGPLTGLRRWREAQAVLEATAADATGLQGPCAVWVAAPVHRRTGLAVAVPQALLQALQQQAAAQRLAVRTLRPWWSAAFNAAAAHLPQARLVVVDDGESLTHLLAAGAADPDVTQAGTQWPAPDNDQRAGWLARQTAAHNLGPQELAVAEVARVHAPGELRHDLMGVPLGAALRAVPWATAAREVAA